MCLDKKNRKGSSVRTHGQPLILNKAESTVNVKVSNVYCSGGFAFWIFFSLLVLAGATYFYLEYTRVSSGILKIDLDRNCKVFCGNSSVLQLVFGGKGLSIYSKQFVDRPLRDSPENVVLAAEKVDPLNTTDIMDFVERYFDPPGSDLETGCSGYLRDFKHGREFDSIQDENLRAFASELHNLWPSLCKKYTSSALDNPARHSLIPLRHPIIMVSGDQSFGSYYWETYFIMLGLLRSSMLDTCMRILENFSDLILDLGIIPSGMRSYYLTRSQPPFFALMVDAYIRKSNDTSVGVEFLPAIEAEYAFWRKEPNQLHVGNHTLARYYDQTPWPRSEAYWEDMQRAEDAGLTLGDRSNYWRSIRSAAASGWDFSSRWCYSEDNASAICGAYLENTMTDRIIPVDLNAILHRVEIILSRYWLIAGNEVKANRYKELAEIRNEAMEAILWDSTNSRYRDLVVLEDERNPSYASHSEFASDFAPLWFMADALKAARKEAMLESLLNSPLVQVGGVSTGVDNGSKQKWDWPNALPPEQLIIINGVRNVGENGIAVARNLTETWITSNYLAYNRTGMMPDMLDSTQLGKEGNNTSSSFGWSIGVVLELLHLYPDMKLMKSVRL